MGPGHQQLALPPLTVVGCGPSSTHAAAASPDNKHVVVECCVGGAGINAGCSPDDAVVLLPGAARMLALQLQHSSALSAEGVAVEQHGRR